MTVPVIDLNEAQQVGARIAARADIRDVRLLRSSAELERSPQTDLSLSYQLTQNAEAEYDEGERHFVIRVKYELQIDEFRNGRDPAPPEDDSAAIANIAFELAALFDLEMREDDEPPKLEELEAFGMTTGQFALYPYAREYIYNVTGRLGLPPLTAAVLRLPTHGRPIKTQGESDSS